MEGDSGERVGDELEIRKCDIISRVLCVLNRNLCAIYAAVKLPLHRLTWTIIML